MPAPGSVSNRRPGCVAYRFSVEGELVEKPLSTMDDFGVARAAIYAGHDRTEVVQASAAGGVVGGPRGPRGGGGVRGGGEIVRAGLGDECGPAASVEVRDLAAAGGVACPVSVGGDPGRGPVDGRSTGERGGCDVALITRANAKTWLGLAGSADDPFLDLAIEAVQAGLDTQLSGGLERPGPYRVPERERDAVAPICRERPVTAVASSRFSMGRTGRCWSRSWRGRTTRSSTSRPRASGE